MTAPDTETRAAIEAALSDLHENKDRWVRLDVDERIAILEEITRDLQAVAPRWISASLEAKGLVSSEHGESTPGRGGRRKRYYRVEPAGVRALREARDEWAAMLDGLEGALEVDG